MDNFDRPSFSVLSINQTTLTEVWVGLKWMKKWHSGKGRHLGILKFLLYQYFLKQLARLNFYIKLSVMDSCIWLHIFKEFDNWHCKIINCILLNTSAYISLDFNSQLNRLVNKESSIFRFRIRIWTLSKKITI